MNTKHAEKNEAPQSEFHCPELEEVRDNATSIASAAGKKMTPERAVDILALARDGLRGADRAYKAVTQAISDQLKPYDALKRIAKGSLTKAEELASSFLQDLLKDGQTLPDITKAGTRLTLSRKWVLAYDDSFDGEIPAEFLKPIAERIDWAKVQAHVDAEKPLPAFARVTRQITLVTKLSEVAE